MLSCPSLLAGILPHAHAMAGPRGRRAEDAMRRWVTRRSFAPRGAASDAYAPRQVRPVALACERQATLGRLAVPQRPASPGVAVAPRTTIGRSGPVGGVKVAPSILSTSVVTVSLSRRSLSRMWPGAEFGVQVGGSSAPDTFR